MWAAECPSGHCCVGAAGPGSAPTARTSQSLHVGFPKCCFTCVCVRACPRPIGPCIRPASMPMTRRYPCDAQSDSFGNGYIVCPLVGWRSGAGKGGRGAHLRDALAWITLPVVDRAVAAGTGAISTAHPHFRSPLHLIWADWHGLARWRGPHHPPAFRGTVAPGHPSQAGRVCC